MTGAATTQPGSRPTGGSGAVLTHDLLLGERLLLHTWVRFAVAAAIVLGSLFAEHVVRVEDLDSTGLQVLALVIVAYNVVIYWIVRGRRDPERAAERVGFLRLVLYASMTLDYLGLTVAIWFVGGARSPFLAFYLFHVIVSSILLPRRGAVASAALACLLLYVLTFGELFKLIPMHAPPGATMTTEPLDGRYALTVLTVYTVLFVMTTALLVSLSELLRRGERRVRDANTQLQRLSEVRRDFLNIALHNLQSPIGAATMLLGNLRSGLMGPLNHNQQEQVARSLARLQGLTGFITDLRTLSNLESGRVSQQAQDIRLAAMLRELVDENQDLARARGQSLTLELPQTLPTVQAVERLLREAIVNYITNAIRYTPEGGRIVVRGRPIDGGARVEVQDNGIGIAQKDQGRLFQEFVRIRTAGSAVGQVEGTGLGLSIVRRIMENLGGRVGVESEPGKGSTFWLEIPGSRARPRR